MSNPQSTIRGERRAGVESNLELRDYRLHEVIGQDELSLIYRATHQTLNRPVYVAILRRHDWISNSRFQMAAQLGASLSHPHLLPVIDAGHDERYGNYMVTPYVNARPLSAILAETKPDLALSVRIISQIAAALDYLHEQKIVHRDVQPANILVTPEGNTYLTNLSLASAPDAPDLSRIEEADYVTPYSAPELRLAQHTAHPSLDIYSLGAVAYHLLSGELPPADLIVEINGANASPELKRAEEVLLRMLSPQPNLRYPTASAAANALRLKLRELLDQATTDMEESRWETCAEWFENPLELALSSELSDLAGQFNDFLAESRKRADELHRRGYLRKWLNRWSRQKFLRRPSLGQLIEFETIASYNIYIYKLKVLYERRTEPRLRQRPMQLDERPRAELPLDVWSVPLPEPQDFSSEQGSEIVLPGSRRFFTCANCQGSGQVVCPQCQGKGVIKPRARRNDTDPVEQQCSTCKGYQKVRCEQCNGNGNMVEEKVFTWSRWGLEHQNDDDSEGLPAQAQKAIEQRSRKVYEAEIDPYDSRWHSVSSLSKLINESIDRVEDEKNMKLIRAHLQITGSMITEIRGLLDDQECELYLIGPERILISTIPLVSFERIMLVAALTLLIVMAAVMVMMLW
ncbi:protein kinase domain-containing protein [uncultured Chloroflexus sp.]|uniref:protein kinase domain-containing protein n=1 Tax=uncultured Chloroflexus sp. TaxID=214040 RepID=UPI0026293208|nr:protein kinase [uncultured Chloroflexus sp.]